MIRRCKKLYTVKQWRRFKKTLVKEDSGIKYNVDIQELMCKKYDIILTDYKTKRERIIVILKKINIKNINKCIDAFNKLVQDFGGFIDEITKEMDSSKEEESNKDKENLEKIWGKQEGKSSNNFKIWSDSPTESEITRDEINLEKFWGKQK